MLLKIIGGLVILVVLFLIFVATRPASFSYSVAEHINAPAEKIFPYVSDLRKGGEWSPFEKMDPNMKKTFEGPPDQVGGKLFFEGNKEAGSGSLELLKIVPNELVEMKLIMTAPFYAENLVQYKVTPQDGGSQFTWKMSGPNGFMGKLIGVLIDCEKMITDQFRAGIKNLKQVVE